MSKAFIKQNNPQNEKSRGLKSGLRAGDGIGPPTTNPPVSKFLLQKVPDSPRIVSIVHCSYNIQ